MGHKGATTEATGGDMEAEALVLALLNALPDHEVRGRKRLQKLAYFAVNTGVDANAKFFLYDYGPFSPQVAAATDYLSFLGEIEEKDAQIGRAKRYLKVYRLATPKDVNYDLPSDAKVALRKLDSYTTIELEVASTILFFLRQGLSLEGAVEATRELKPTKSEQVILMRAKEALAKVGLHERRRENQVPGS